ncbi:MAG: glycosyltransferase [Candidatus Komeilibacteria bacterium]|nr:glycosyltransferase [Candidatus Komeilibacteria bacterium]
MQYSIIIPAKNELHNLQRTLPQFADLKGAVAYELILADGASTDGTIEFARSKGARVEVKTKLDRETIGEGRNRGAHVATGDILVFLDAGVMVKDILNFFQTIQAAFAHASVVAAVPKVNIDPKEATFSDELVHGGVNILVRFFNFMGWGAGKGECQIVRRSAFEAVGGYNEKLVAAEDNDLYSRLAKKGRVVFLKELQVYDDPARYRKKGYLRVISLWLMNQIFVRLLGRSYSKEWKRAS